MNGTRLPAQAVSGWSRPPSYDDMAESRATFTVRGVESDDDAAQIEESVRELNGVQAAELDRESSEASVRYGEELLSEEAIKDAVRERGYEVD